MTLGAVVFRPGSGPPVRCSLRERPSTAVVSACSIFRSLPLLLTRRAVALFCRTGPAEHGQAALHPRPGLGLGCHGVPAASGEG